MECVFTSPVRTECGMFVRYIDVCYCDMFSVVNVYLDHLKFCVVCINSRRYVCCSECDVVSNECNEPTSGSGHGPMQMTSQSHPHTLVRVQPRNTYNHTYTKFLPGQNKTTSY